MKTKLLLGFILFTTMSYAQTVVPYLQRIANYTTPYFVTPSSTSTPRTGDFIDNILEPNAVNLQANGTGNGAVIWRNFTTTGTPLGIPTVMKVGDIFTYVSNFAAPIGMVGISLLSSPTSQSSWNDRINNYAVEVKSSGGVAIDIISAGVQLLIPQPYFQTWNGKM